MKMFYRKVREYAVFAVLMLALMNAAQAEESQAVVLMYHHFGVQEHPSTNVQLAQFDAHLDYLSQAGYQVWPLAKVVEYVVAKRPFPARVVAITVDDAYQSVFTEAYPRLKKRGWPFTVFVSTDGVDRHFKAYMGWSQMREMQAHGVSFENHSASHDYLIRHLDDENEDQWRARVSADIGRAQRRIREELGTEPQLFAYPYGEYTTVLADIVVGMGLVAFGQQSGPVGLGADPRVIPRFPMAERFAAIDDFKQKVQSLAFPLEDVQPWEPWVDAQPQRENAAPIMTIRLGDSTARLNQLSCFVSGQGRVEVQWRDRATRVFALQAPQALPHGRSRYNCTAPSPQPGRYFWFSHLWISP
jgi:peptidoglycan/xylan/chitin deacetylase (PgdA/CDA1 family)